MLETAVQLERDPPDTATSESTKSVDASERVKVRVDVSPELRESLSSSSVMTMVGGVFVSVGVGVGVGVGDGVGVGEGLGEGDGEGEGEGLVVVLTVRVTELLASEPSRLRLPNEFEKVPDPTDMTASVVLLELGVKVAE